MVKRYSLAVDETVILLSFCDWQPLLDCDTNESWVKAAKAREAEDIRSRATDQTHHTFIHYLVKSLS